MDRIAGDVGERYMSLVLMCSKAVIHPYWLNEHHCSVTIMSDSAILKDYSMLGFCLPYLLSLFQPKSIEMVMPSNPFPS